MDRSTRSVEKEKSRFAEGLGVVLEKKEPRRTPELGPRNWREGAAV